jgi:hypothetical protein
VDAGGAGGRQPPDGVDGDKSPVEPFPVDRARRKKGRQRGGHGSNGGRVPPHGLDPDCEHCAYLAALIARRQAAAGGKGPDAGPG